MMATRCSPIEKDIQARTEAALTEKGHDWAKVTLDGRGRDIMLNGVAPNEAARNEAVETATAIYGARIVESGITIKEYSTPVFGLNNEDGKTILTGSFPEQGLIDTTLRAASDNFGPENVVNRMTVSDDVSAPTWLNSALSVLPTITGMEDADFDITNEGATLNGTFHTEEEKLAFATLATDKLSGKFTDSSVVVPLGPTPEELAEIARAAEEAEAVKIAEEKRVAAEAEVARMAEEASTVAQVAKLAEAEMAEVKRLADIETAKAEMAEVKRLADIETAKAEMAEVKRLADIETAKAEMAEVKRLADIETAKAEMAAAKVAEEERFAAEVAAEKLARETQLAEAAALEEAESMRAEEEKATLAAQKASALAELESCQNKLNAAMNGNSILFATSSSKINTKSYPLLDTIALTVRQCGETIISNAKNIEISGHTDSRGADTMNLKLSESRAKSVRDYLLGKGVRSSALTSKGYGEVNPVATNNTAAGRQLNRRIQFTIQ